MKCFTRLTPNFNNWSKPSGSKGKCKSVNSRKPLYEETNSFGWEEWLFKDYYEGKEICLGFLQAFNGQNFHIKSVDTIHLYTRLCKGQNTTQYYVGYINNVKVLPENQRVLSKKAKESKLKDLTEANIADFSVHDPMWDKSYNIEFSREHVFLTKNFLENEIDLHVGQYRFALYELKAHPNFLSLIHNNC